jgi:hypothetical protein
MNRGVFLIVFSLDDGFEGLFLTWWAQDQPALSIAKVETQVKTKKG